MRKMREAMLAILAGLLSLMLFCINVQASGEEVAINEALFPDEIFRAYVADNFDRDGNGKLSEVEIKAADHIYLNGYESGKKIKTVQGIEYLTEVESLNLYGNGLTEIDISALVKLKTLNVGTNELTRLDVSKNTALETLSCGRNRLTALNVSANTELRSLGCSLNRLTKLDVSKNTKLIYLYCDANELTELDISHNTLLEQLYCNDNAIKTLDIHLQKNLLKAYLSPNIKGTNEPETIASYYYRFYNESKEYVDQYSLKIDRSVKLLCKPKITSPASGTTRTVKANKKVSLKVVANGSGLKYQWYYKKPGSNKLIKVSAKAGKKATYTFKALAKHDGYRYYCKVTNKYGTTTSYEIKLTVKVKPKITSPKKATTKTVAKGKTATFTVKATGASIYQWEYMVSKDAPWQEVTLASGKTAKYKLTVQERHNGYQYRCRVSNSSGITVYSKVITLKVK